MKQTCFMVYFRSFCCIDISVITILTAIKLCKFVRFAWKSDFSSNFIVVLSLLLLLCCPNWHLTSGVWRSGSPWINAGCMHCCLALLYQVSKVDWCYIHQYIRLFLIQLLKSSWPYVLISAPLWFVDNICIYVYIYTEKLTSYSA